MSMGIDLRCIGRRLAAAVIVLGLAAPAAAQLDDCEDVDHDCTADRFVARGIKKAGRQLLRCVDKGITLCDLTEALEKIISPDCRFAVECELTNLFADVGDGSSDCVQRLFKEGYKFMAKKATRIDRERLDKIPEDLLKCKEKAGRRCIDPIAPPLTDDCAGETTPLDGADCICNQADVLSNHMLLTPATCEPPPAPAPEALAAPPPVVLPADLPGVGGFGNPNIILILTDDQRWDTVGPTHSLNGMVDVMPYVQSRLAASGVTFPNGYVTTAVCCPSRASILRGQYAHNTGIHKNAPPNGGAEEFDDEQTIATWLQADGYRTGFVGKYLNGYATLAPCVPPGWDEWHAFVQVKFYDYDFNDNGVITHYGTTTPEYSQTILTQRALQFIDDAVDDNRHFFLYFAPKAPHGPATPRPDHEGLFQTLTAFRPPNYAVVPVNGPTWTQSLNWTSNEMTNTDQFRKDQLESLQAVDEAVRDIMDKLVARNIDNDTLVVFSSDNGFSWGSHMWRPKTCPYEECMHVPMIMRYPPSGTTARVDNSFVLNIDFAATFVDLAAAPVPLGYTLNGASVVPLLYGSPTSWRTDFLNEHWGGQIPDNVLVRTPDYKFVEYYTLNPVETELYDLRPGFDPYELNNVTNDAGYAGIKATLKARVDDLRDD